MIVTEGDLERFRTERLSPQAILRDVEQSVQILYRLPVGVGKSLAADRLLAHPDTYSRFQLVVYAAPSWNILNERPIVAGREKAPVPWRIFRPRPSERCGSRAEEWDILEKHGCSAYGKGTLCRECRGEAGRSSRCFWSKQFSDLRGIGLIFTTEQQLVLNRSLVWMLKNRTGAGRVLVVLDEARLLDTSFEITLEPQDLERFLELIRILRRPRGIPTKIADAWRRAITFLLSASSEELADNPLSLPGALNSRAFLIQSEGTKMLGRAFRYVGYDLALIQWGAPQERWKDSAGRIHFMARPYLNCHLLVLSAHLRAAYTAHRLGKSSIASPFEHVRFHHSGTRVLNLRNRIGADAYFKRNHKQILDFFAVLILRNILQRRSTFLVSRKKSKCLCVEYLERRLRAWGLPVRFVTEAFEDLPREPRPDTIPVVHYGILGVNDFTEYECAFCVNSYYISDRELNRHVQEAEPERFRVMLRIVSSPGMRRRVEIQEKDNPDLDRTALGNIYLRKLEVDPVIQAAGRVRFLTRPREVVLFQMHDLSAELGDCEDAPTLAALRDKMGLPTAKEIDHLIEAHRAEELIGKGFTAQEAASELGLSRRTLFRRLGAAESAKTPYIYIIRLFGTPPAAGGGSP